MKAQLTENAHRMANAPLIANSFKRQANKIRNYQSLLDSCEKANRQHVNMYYIMMDDLRMLANEIAQVVFGNDAASIDAFMELATLESPNEDN